MENKTTYRPSPEDPGWYRWMALNDPSFSAAVKFIRAGVEALLAETKAHGDISTGTFARMHALRDVLAVINGGDADPMEAAASDVMRVDGGEARGGDDA